ncbi:hypothetical protein AALP_AA3G034600 [Arabis alpina]|uniref:DUF7477 domain-containing protein n=1 Tax=Arabis alpina TaxID=50452 RepID=A0A087H6S7_ARAAL|nr:hypothetical protein AALP_AA3G034600 [Arabis alpina]
MKQRYHYNVQDTRVYEHIEKGIKNGIFISCVASSRDLWAIIMDGGTGFSSQVCDLSSDFLRKNWIVEQWEKKYHISSVAGANNGKSLVVMSQGTNYTQQSYKITSTFPYTWINKKWKDGFHVTSMATSRGRWCVVMSVNSGYFDQVVELDSLHLSERIQRKSECGYIITSMAATSDQTAFILSKPKQKVTDETQETHRTSSFPKTHVKENWAKNMFVTSLCYGRTVSGQNALKCDDIPDFLAGLNISDNHQNSGNEESNHVTNFSHNLESSFLNQGKDKVVAADNELEGCDDFPNALAALHISDNHQKSGNEGSSHVTKLDSSLPFQENDKVSVGDGDVLPITHIASVDLPSTSGTCEEEEEDKTTCNIEKKST